MNVLKLFHQLIKIIKFKFNMNSKFLESRPLFKECVEALKATILDLTESQKMSQYFINTFPITKWGKIDWQKINNKINIGYEPKNIIPALEKLINKPIDKSVYIEWSGGGIPIIKTELDSIIQHFDDVTCVSFEKFIFNISQNYIIEILPSYEITIGIIENK